MLRRFSSGSFEVEKTLTRLENGLDILEAKPCLRNSQPILSTSTSSHVSILGLENSLGSALNDTLDALKNIISSGNDEDSKRFITLLLEANIPTRLIFTLDRIAINSSWGNTVVNIVDALMDLNSNPAVSTFLLTHATKIVESVIQNLLWIYNHNSYAANSKLLQMYHTILRHCIRRSVFWDICFEHNPSLVEVLFECLQSGNLPTDESNEAVIQSSMRLLGKLLTCNPSGTAKYLARCETSLSPGLKSLFEKLNGLLRSESKLVVRSSLKLLSHILLAESNREYMMQYICNKENLLLLIYVLRENKQDHDILLHGFHVLKIFIAYPNKSGAAVDILLKNRKSLLKIMTIVGEANPGGCLEYAAIVKVLLTLSPLENSCLDPIITENRLVQTKNLLYDATDSPESLEASRVMTRLLLCADIPMLILKSFTVLPSIRSRQSACQILTCIILSTDHTIHPKIEAYLKERSRLFVSLLTSHCQETGLKEIYFHLLGVFLRRKCLRERYVTMKFFSSLSGFLQHENLAVRQNAFLTLECVIMQHEEMAHFLHKYKDYFFPMYHKLLLTKYEDIQRKAIKTLSTILLGMHPLMGAVRLHYVSSRRNLKLTMKMMCVGCPIMRFDAFHVFKIFVINPDKPESIVQVLSENRDQLVLYLRSFATDEQLRQETFVQERNLVIQTLSLLRQLPVSETHKMRNYTSCSSTVTTTSSNSAAKSFECV